MIKINAGPEFKKNMDGTGEAIAAMAGEVADQFADIDGKIKEQVDSAILRARKAGHSIHAFVKENPWQVAGLALAAGFLAGWIMKK